MSKTNHMTGSKIRKMQCSTFHQVRGMNHTIRQLREECGELRAECAELKRMLADQREIGKEILERFRRQQETIALRSQDDRALGKKRERDLLMGHVTIHDHLFKNMASFEKRGRKDSEGYVLLKMYADWLAEILEEAEVEILAGNPGIMFDPDFHLPTERVEAAGEEDHERVCRVNSCGYRWNGVMLKKMEVAVSIYRHSER